MPNKKTLALTEESYKKIIETMKAGFIYKDQCGQEKRFNPNNKVATALVVEANLGLRISDILALRLKDIVKDGDRYRLDISELKTGKTRYFTVPGEIYRYLENYTLKNNIKATARIFNVTERAVQKQLKIVADYLGLTGIGTHSFRKFFATQVYTANGYNIELVRTLLQHSNSAITQRYIGIQQKDVEEALNKHIQLI